MSRHDGQHGDLGPKGKLTETAEVRNGENPECEEFYGVKNCLGSEREPSGTSGTVPVPSVRSGRQLRIHKLPANAAIRVAQRSEDHLDAFKRGGKKSVKVCQSLFQKSVWRQLLTAAVSRGGFGAASAFDPSLSCPSITCLVPKRNAAELSSSNLFNMQLQDEPEQPWQEHLQWTDPAPQEDAARERARQQKNTTQSKQSQLIPLYPNMAT